jgi:predicted phage terminase large subunit-like protein
MARKAGLPLSVFQANLEKVRAGMVDVRKFQAEYLQTENIYTKVFPMFPKQKAFCMLPHYQAMAGGASGNGKALCNQQLIPTPQGYRRFGNIREGDYVIGSNGKPTKVIGVYPQGIRPCSRVTFSDGSSVTAADDHLWTVSREVTGRKPLQTRVVRTDELRGLSARKADTIPMLSGPVEFDCGPDPELDGYFLGYAIGNGELTSLAGRQVSIAMDDRDAPDILVHLGSPDRTYLAQGTHSFHVTYGASKRDALDKLGLLGLYSGERFIPEVALRASPAYRIAVLQGLMDSDGMAFRKKNTHQIRFDTTSHKLAENFRELVEGLGGRAVISTADRTAAGKGIEYPISLRLPSWVQPFRLPRKVALYQPDYTKKKGMVAPKRSVRTVEPVAPEECTCIAVEAEDHLFCTKHYILTHNSEVLIRAALQYVTRPNYRALILRRTLGQLASPNSIMDRTLRRMQAAGVPFHFNSDTHEVRFPAGAVLKFGHMNTEQDKFQYDGPEFHFIGIDEAGQFSQTQLEFIFLRLRKVITDPIPLRYRLVSNPGGISHIFLRDKYVLNQGKDPDIAYIPFYIEDNPAIDLVQYEKSLKNLDPLTYRQRRYGDWMATRTDAVFQREWFLMQPVPVAGKCLRLRFWDLAATDPKPNTDPDYTVGILMARDSIGRIVVEDMQRFRSNPAIVEQRVIGTMKSDGVNVFQRIEREPGASGKSLVSHFVRSLPGYNIMGVAPGGPKRARWSPFAAQAQNQNVWLVNSVWATDWLQEICGLTGDNDLHDDIGDATAGAFNTMCTEFLMSTPGISRVNP